MDRRDLEKIAQGVKDITGEETQVSIHVKKKIPRQSSTYTMFYQTINLELVKHLKPNSCKVLMYMMAKTGYDNMLGVNQETIMEELDYKSIRSVISAISELKKMNILVSVRDLADKRRNVYFINPLQSWKGPVVKRIQAVARLTDINADQLSLPFYPKDKQPTI